MPKARKKKNSSFQTTITKSVFLYGRPNKEKLAVLRQMQNSYTALINRDIELLEKNPDIVLQLVKNDKKAKAGKSHSPRRNQFCILPECIRCGSRAGIGSFE